MTPKRTVKNEIRQKTTSSRPKVVKIEPPRTVTSRLETSIKAATWLKESDLGSVELALKLSLIVDSVSDLEELKAAAPAINALVKLLNDLGLTSKGRPLDETKPEGIDWLDELRKRKTTAASRKH